MSDYLTTDDHRRPDRNPPKSLIRFTTVCKYWQSIITSAIFISSHFSNTKDHNTLLLRRRDKDNNRELYSLLKVTGDDEPFVVNSSPQLEFPFKSRNEHFRIVGCCDGLVCLSGDLTNFSRQPIIVWNPSVRNHVVLPNPTINLTESHMYSVLGFGVARHAYIKVVRLVYCMDFNYYNCIRVPPQAKIFFLKTWSWRRVSGADDVTLRAPRIIYHQVFLNGFVHWLPYEPIQDNDSSCTILGFDIDNEVFGEVMLPDELASVRLMDLCMFVIEESLGVVNPEGYCKPCDVWVMKEYCAEESWTKLYTIDLREGFEKVVGFCKSGEALLTTYLPVYLLAYDPETNQTKDLGLMGLTRHYVLIIMWKA